ncbi:hypothetical protein J7337_013862 [Fusarium musae]|uniref:Uncharacterized protein n=1 Tax=Fusarium musae TaxID=1042133 RepID=A0A9P8II76_9HYPO|nr:hypothetical protein J7337_013862 [Fusarium musae]KAG9494723.1 hypothetical protein J7337_013862 [Fusarium musae]
MSKLDITRKSMNVSISGQSDMRKMAAIIATLASYGHEQAQMTLAAVLGSLTPPRALLEGRMWSTWACDDDEAARDAESQGVQVNFRERGPEVEDEKA